MRNGLVHGIAIPSSRIRLAALEATMVSPNPYSVEILGAKGLLVSHHGDLISISRQ